MQEIIQLQRRRQSDEPDECQRPASSGSVTDVLRRWLPRREILMLPAALLMLVVLWQAAVWITNYPTFILPAPLDVVQAGQLVIADGTLWAHARTTLFELFAGLGLGLLAAVLLGYPLAKSRHLERLISPYLVISQSVPVVAIAPLLIIWFGSGH